MEAQSSRRPIDKQREMGLKKPRLEETAERGVPPRAAGTGSNAFLARFRANERERDVSRGRIAVDEVKEREEPGRRAYHQLQELLSQYKTALGELTFNSKPIITNLTIIAGENTHAAKGIAATICAHILEVPNEQKLHSLYLLDSIVKNIGGDYVKYFAARLPEVFCEAYRKVDPSTHPSMQHLFRTWRGVFPSPTLRIIEQQLNFAPSANSSSSGGASTSKTDPPSQRTGHSIHLNPKYFEARQHLQQSNKSKGIETENSRSILKEDLMTPAQTTVSGGPKRWAEVSVKMARVQRDEKLIEPVYDKRPGSGYVDYDVISDPPNHQKVANKWSGERTTEGNEGTDEAWHGGTGSNKANTLLGKKNSYDMSHLSSRDLVDSYGNHRASRSGGTLPQLDSVPNIASLSTRNTFQNWKNSDEEEFVWDDMNSRPKDVIEGDGLKKGRNHDYSAKPLGERMRKWMPADSEQLARRWSEGGLLSRSEQPVRGNDRFPAQLELDDQESHGWKEAYPTDPKGMSIDSSSLGQEVEPKFGHQAGRIQLSRLNQSRSVSRLRPSDAVKHPSNDSVGTDQVEGFSVTFSDSLNSNVSQPSLTKMGVGVQIGPIASSTFGSFQHVAPGSSGMPAHQKNRKPPSPSSRALHQQPYSPSSLHQKAFRIQPQNLPEQEHPEVISFPPGQNALHGGGLAKASPEIPGNHKLQGVASNQLNSRLSVHLQPLQQFDNISSTPVQQRAHLPFLQAEPSQPPGISNLAQTQPQDFGFQTITPTSLLKNSSAGLSGDANTSSLLATILNNGLLSLNSAATGDVTKLTSSFSDTRHSEFTQPESRISTLPPLPTGPPPMQNLASSQGPGRESALSALSQPLLGTSQPPLPPGPPPPSSIVGTSSQSSGNIVANPLSNLLSSLVAKGLISTSAPETSKVTPPPVPIQTQNQNEGAVASNSILGSSKPNLLMASPLTPPDGDLSISESSSLPSGRSNASAETRECIGVEFKSEVIREFHASVIIGLFDDLPCQCSICGLRFKDEGSLSQHLSWHASRKLEPNNSGRISRKWYATLREWVEGEVGPSSNAMDALADGSTLIAESSEPMVPADESQCICVLCGEPFEDFYCHKRDQWMFKGALFMSIPTDRTGTVDPDSSPKQIVHVNCSSKSSRGGLED